MDARRFTKADLARRQFAAPRCAASGASVHDAATC